MTNKRMYSLDVLKIIATTFLVFHHYQQFTETQFKYINFYFGSFYFGWIVELFFLLSGFFTYQYIEKIYQGGIKFKIFIFHKAARLLPLVFIATVILQVNLCIYYILYSGAGFGPVTHVGDWVSIWRLISASLGIDSGWVIISEPELATWYISVLMLCYVVFYMLTSAAKSIEISPTYLYIFMILLGIAINSYAIDMPFLNVRSARGFYSFFYGLMFAMHKNKIEVQRWIKLGSVLTVLFIMGIYFVSYFIPGGGVKRAVTGGESQEGYILTFVLYPALMIIADFQLFQKIFDHKLLGILGKCSFNVYIWHIPLLVLFYNIMKLGSLSVDVHALSSMIGFTVVMWIIGIASYYCLERKINIFLFDKIEKLQ